MTNGVIDKKSLWFWERKTHEEKIKIRISEMKKSLNTLGIKKYFLQNISTRMLKENIEITFEKISEIKKNIRLIQFFVQHMREVTRITMLRILFVQDLKINVKFMNLLSIIFLIIEFVAITFLFHQKKIILFS